MKVDGSVLNESYQMKLFAPGLYYKTFADAQNCVETNRETEMVYADIFLWDEAWELPKYNGVTMERVDKKQAYSLTDFEIKTHYYTYGYLTTNSSSYAPSNNEIFTIFRAKESRTSGTGTVTVKDRFGHEYSQTISW